MTGPMGAAALALAARGWPVLPCHPSGERAKSPMTRHGHRNASTDPEVIHSWWRRWPQALIGCPVRRPLLVLDIDPRNGGSFAGLQTVLGPLPPTLTTVSGRCDGGVHLWYRRPDCPLVAAGLPPGVDLKLKGYVIVPPSVHPATGRPYRWIGRPIAALPDPAVRALRAPVSRPRAAVPKVGADGMTRKAAALVRAVSDAPAGKRNDVLFWAARAALDEAHDPGVLHDLTVAAYAAGLSEAEAARTVESAARAHTAVAHG